jgi:oligoribonuclease
LTEAPPKAQASAQVSVLAPTTEDHPPMTTPALRGNPSRAPFEPDHLVWLDMEMSGLDPETCVPLEIATLVTNGALEVIATGPNLIIHQPDSVLDAMDHWNTEHHGESGLTAAVRASTISCAEAEAATVAFLEQWVRPGTSPLCGNSVGQDRRFLYRYMPRLEDFFHYRTIDVSTVKELVRRWYGRVSPAKKGAHRALDDIHESIAELRWYRETAFREALLELPDAPSRPVAEPR